MSQAGVLFSIGRHGMAAALVAGGIFNLTFGRSHPRQFYGSFAASAWLRPYARLIDGVIVPNGAVFALVIGAAELALAALILAGGTPTAIGLAGATAFALLIVPASSPPGALANLAPATVAAVLLWSHLQAS